MRFWYPDVCPPGGQCVLEIGAGTDHFVQYVRKCPHHKVMALAFGDREIHASITHSNKLREYARYAAKMALGLHKKHPGVWYRTETDGSFTLGVDQKGRKMPEWPETIDALIPVFNAMAEAAARVPVVPGRSTVNNLAFGKALLVGGQSGSLALASGDFASLIGYGNDAGATEANATVSATEGATFTNLRARVSAGGSGTNTFQFRDAGANGQNVCSVAGTGLAEDTTHTDTLTAGDTFAIAYTDTGTNSTCPWIAMNVEFASGHGNFHGAATFPGTVHDVPSTMRFIGIGGNTPADGQATEANVQWKNRAYTSWDALQVRCSANARTNNSDFTNEINGTTGAALCRFSAGATGLVTDTTVGDSLADGDLICVGITLDTGVEDLNVNFVCATLKSTSQRSDVIAMDQAGNARTASATANYYQLGGLINAASALAETDARVKIGFAGIARNLRCYLSANTYTGNGTLKLMLNGVAALTVTLTAGGGAAWYENTTDAVAFDADDVMSFEIDEGTANSITVHSMGVTFAPYAKTRLWHHYNTMGSA